MNSQLKALENELRSRGVMTARQAAHTLRVSQPTVSRLFAHMGRQRLLRLGRGRSTRYALLRAVRALGSTWPLYRIAADSTPHLVGHLYAMEAGQWHLEQTQPWDSFRRTEFQDGIYPGLPWFLLDLRPQGFLGRCFARNYATQLGAPPDPRRWNDDDIIAALMQFGIDLPGDLVIGGTALSALQTRMGASVDRIPSSQRHTEYPVRAETLLTGGLPGSSAAGEQPKFIACVGDSADSVRHVIVKFSGSGGRPEDRRWSDLLVAEHVANAVLMENGIPSSATVIIEAKGRTFLESTRFDRVGTHGRLGLVSLEALDAAFFGQIDTPWTLAAERLRIDHWISTEDAERLTLLWWFGTLIGNTDMHYGNISLFMTPERPLKLAPTYDMVPMCYRPDIEGRFSDSPLTPVPPPPEAVQTWSRAAILAHTFWSRLSDETLVSASFRQIAAQNARVVREQHNRFVA